MKKLFILILPIALIMGVANAQTDSSVQNANLKRENFRLAFDTPNSSVLKKEELKILLSDKQFSTYNHARSCYIASIPLLTVSSVFFTFGSFFLVAGLSTEGLTKAIAMMISIANFGVTSIFLIPGTTLIIYSAKKLNNIAEDYNNQRLSSYYQRNVQLNFGFTQNGICFKLNF